MTSHFPVWIVLLQALLNIICTVYWSDEYDINFYMSESKLFMLYVPCLSSTIPRLVVQMCVFQSRLGLASSLLNSHTSEFQTVLYSTTYHGIASPIFKSPVVETIRMNVYTYNLGLSRE